MKAEQLLADEFPLDPDILYLNHAAVAPWPARTAAAVKHFADENIHRGASRYGDWLAKESDLRLQLQRLINAPSIDDIALLKNTSEAISVVACGLHWTAGDNIVSTKEEFPSNRIAWQAQAVHGVEYREACIAVEDPEAALMAACDERTRLMTVSAVQYASGRRLDLVRLGRFCRSEGILFCVDAIQALGALRIDVQTCMADFLMADAHKWLLGPEGIAVFYCRTALRDQLRLYQYGWHMVEALGDYDRKDWRPAVSARRFECGSMNMLGIYALSASVSLLEEFGMQEIEQAVLKNSAYLIDKLANIPGIHIATPVSGHAHAGIVSFRVTGTDNQKLFEKLVKSGVICAFRGGNIRFSPHFYSSQKLYSALEVLSVNI